MFISPLASFVVGSWVEQWPSLSAGFSLMTRGMTMLHNGVRPHVSGHHGVTGAAHLWQVSHWWWWIRVTNTPATLHCLHRNNIANVTISLMILTVAWPCHILSQYCIIWAECTLVCPGAGLWPWAAHCQIMTNVTMIQHTISHFLVLQEGPCLINSFADGQSTNSIFPSPEKEVRIENMTETRMKRRGHNAGMLGTRHW